ncbi:MAG: serine hydrolase [Acidobacteria bacterium]|nr:serine hydrolase [Acidobacteriota bacterium]
MHFLLLALLTAAPAQPQPLDALRSNIERITRSVNATWGIYVKSIETGEEIDINAGRQLDTMSVIKIPLMAEVFFQIREGKLKRDDRYTLAAADIRPGTGVMRSLDTGGTYTVKDLLTLMIIVSDNTATDVLYRMTGGPEATTRRMAALGLKQTVAPAASKVWFDGLRAAGSAEKFHRAAKTPYGLSSPRDIGTLLERMERGTLVDEAASKMMLSILRGQIYRTRLPRYLSGIGIPHKTGDFLPYIANDVGVLELAPGNRVVICIFTANHFGEGVMLEQAEGRIAEAVARYFQARG